MEQVLPAVAVAPVPGSVSSNWSPLAVVVIAMPCFYHRSVSLTLRLYTDFVCPFCFIAEQSTVPRLLADFELTLDWRGFELHPGTPRGGLPLEQLFPGRPLAQMHAGTKRFAARFGVTEFEPPNRLQNSRRALAIAELAREVDRLEPFRKAALNAHWRRGQ